MKRVMIVGGPGSGKSTLAASLGILTNLPVFHIDHIHWKPGWIERTQEEKAPLINKVHALDSWVFEGGHSRSYAQRVARADTMIWLDLATHLRLWRVMRRTMTGLGKTRPDMTENCPERLDIETLHFYAFVWRTRKSSREKIQAIADDPPPHLTIHHLKNPPEVAAFLNQLQNPSATGARV